MTRAAVVLVAFALQSKPGLAQEPLSAPEQDALAALTEEYATAYELIDSWFEGRPIQYYDFGPSPVDAGTLYRVRGGGDVLVTVPGLDGYTTLRQLLEVQVTGAGVDPSTVRSHTEISRLIALGEARLVATGIILNLPVVPAGSTLERDPEARAPRTAWYKGRPVTYFDFGPNRAAPTPLIAFGKVGADGEIEIVQGTNVARVPGVAGYTDIWGVTLVLGGRYQPGSYRDYARALADAKAGRFDEVRPRPSRNCPVMYIDGVPAPRPLAQWMAP